MATFIFKDRSDADLFKGRNFHRTLGVNMLTGMWCPGHDDMDWKPVHYVQMAHIILDHKRLGSHDKSLLECERAANDEELLGHGDPRVGAIGQPYNVYIRGAYYVWIRGGKTWFTVLEDSNGNVWTTRHDHPDRH